jgi:hypothetical protein
MNKPHFNGYCTKLTTAWFITVDGAFAYLTHTKTSASILAIDLCHELWDGKKIMSELSICDRNGRVKEKNTYPRSSDPRRTKG